MSYLRYLCLFAHSGVQHMLCFSFVILRLVYYMLPVSLDFPFLMAPSVFSNGYQLFRDLDASMTSFVPWLLTDMNPSLVLCLNTKKNV